MAHSNHAPTPPQLKIGFWNVDSVNCDGFWKKAEPVLNKYNLGSIEEIDEFVKIAPEECSCTTEAKDIAQKLRDSSLQMQLSQGSSVIVEKFINNPNCETFQNVKDIRTESKNDYDLLSEKAIAIKNPQCPYNLLRSLEKEKPAVIEKEMGKGKQTCDILVCSEAKRPSKGLYFTKAVLDQGYGWGKLHTYDAYWVGVGTREQEVKKEASNKKFQFTSVNGVLLVFTKQYKEKIVGDPKTFSYWERNSPELFPKMDSFLLDGEVHRKDTFEKFWFEFLREHWIEDMETRMLYVKLEVEQNRFVNVFGCYVKVDDKTNEKDYFAIIFFLKLNRILKKIESECEQNKRKEFVVICGDFNIKRNKTSLEEQNPGAKISPADENLAAETSSEEENSLAETSSEEENSQAKTFSQEGNQQAQTSSKNKNSPAQKKQKKKGQRQVRRVLLNEFCLKFKFEIAEHDDRGLKTHKGSKGSKGSKDSNLDHLVYGWIGPGKSNPLPRNHNVEVFPSPTGTESKRHFTHRLCRCQLDLKWNDTEE